MPQLGETVDEGTVAVWHKKAGDKVAVDEVLVEIETDKVATEVPSLVAGTLRIILVPAGETVKVGTTLAIIDSGDGDADAKSGGATAAATVRYAPTSFRTPATPPNAPADRPAATSRQETGPQARLSPVVRKLLAEHRVDPAQIRGTGRDGRIKRDDVLAQLKTYQAAPAPTRAPPPGATDTVVFSAQRKRIAEHMVRSKATSAHVLQAVEVDFSGVEAARGALKKAWAEREGIPLTYLPFIARAVALALPDFPHLNAHVAADALTVYRAINLAVAVDVAHGELIAPVIKNVGALRVPELARAITRMVAKARSHSLKPDDMTEGTYSLSNNGSFGTFLTAPIINQPQVAILSIDGIQRRPWVVTHEKRERIEICPVGVLAQSFDHRAVDGAYSGAYLRRLKQIIETHEWIGEFLN